MSVPFDPTAPSIRLRAEVAGPARTLRFWFVLDTGATRTTVRTSVLRFLGYDLSAGPTVRMSSVTGVAEAKTIPVARISALEVSRFDQHVVAYDFPAAVRADGLLGLDFFRGQLLTLDFARGLVTLRPPRRWWPFGN